MECPNCHHWNETGARFCEECGFELKDSAASAASNPVQVPLSSSKPDQSAVSATPVAPTTAPADPAVVPDPAPQMLVTPESPAGASPAYNGAHFVLNATGSVFKLGNVTLLGREEPTAQIDFDGYPDGKFVSHRHAQVTDNNGVFYIEDLGSSNHTYVNGIKLSPGQSEPLHDGDMIRVGKIELLFHEK